LAAGASQKIFCWKGYKYENIARGNGMKGFGIALMVIALLALLALLFYMIFQFVI
jgi:hypothetical protein